MSKDKVQLESMGTAIADIITDSLSTFLRQGGTLDEIKANGKKKEVTESQKVMDVANLMLNGIGSDGEKSEVATLDFITSNEIRPFIPQAITTILTMPMEPMAQIYKRFRSITLPAGQQVSFPSIGGLPEAQDMGEAEQYPTLSKFEMSGQITALTGKVGCKVSFTEEAWALSKSVAEFNLLGMLLQGVGRALERTKERKAANFLLRQGRVAFDNIGSGGRRTSGRDAQGALNGTLMATDLIQLWSEMLADGFNPDMIIYHPLAFPMFIRDHELRNWAFQNGTPAMAKLWQKPDGMSGFKQFKQNVPPLHKRHDPMTELSTLNTKPFPNQLPFTLESVVSPYAFYSGASGSYPNHVDIIVADSNYLGYLINEGGINTGEWQNPETDLKNFKASEKYAFATEMVGMGIRVIKGVAIDRHAFDFINKFSYAPVFDEPIDLDGWVTGEAVYS